MRVEIYDPECNAEKISGFTIVVDVFRAFSMSYYIESKKPERYIVTDSIAHAESLRSEFKNAILIGERNGLKIDGFDYGNSPTEINAEDFSNKTIVHTTTSGTKGILKQPLHNEVVVGSFVNLEAMISYIQHNNKDVVNIYCTAMKGDEYGEEDYIFADYMKKRLLQEECSFEEVVSTLRNRSGKYLSETGFAPYTDFLYCMDINRFNQILRRKVVSLPSHSVELENIF